MNLDQQSEKIVANSEGDIGFLGELLTYLEVWMKEFLNLALDMINSAGANYGDIRIVETLSEWIYLKNGHPLGKDRRFQCKAPGKES